MFKNMKIKVENNLDEIVAELERLGVPDNVVFHNDGVLLIIHPNTYDQFVPCELTTLAELKEM